MSKVFGIAVDVKFDEQFTFTDEWVDAIYSSLERNMAMLSVDVFAKEEDATLTFLVGVRTFLDETPDGAAEILNEAIDKALNDAVGGSPSEERVITKNEVLQFA